MKKLNTSVALAALAAVLATPALAADPVPEVIPEAANWTAFHVGVGGGGTFGFADDSANLDFDNTNDDNNHYHANAEAFADLGEAGWLGTVEAGFDYQMDSFVIGVLANYDFGKTKMSHEFDGTVNNDNNVIDFVSAESKWEIGDSWAVGGRLGFLAMDSALVYVLGGYTMGKIKSESSMSSDNNNFSVSFSDSKWEDGWFVGGGIEALLTEDISLKGEYRYADFGKIDRSDDVDLGPNTDASTDHEADITVHSIRAVLSYRFGL